MREHGRRIEAATDYFFFAVFRLAGFFFALLAFFAAALFALFFIIDRAPLVAIGTRTMN